MTSNEYQEKKVENSAMLAAMVAVMGRMRVLSSDMSAALDRELVRSRLRRFRRPQSPEAEEDEGKQADDSERVRRVGDIAGRADVRGPEKIVRTA